MKWIKELKREEIFLDVWREYKSARRCWCSLTENYGVVPPVVLGYVLAPGVDPLQMLDELDVGDLGPAGQHQVITRPDLLPAGG